MTKIILISVILGISLVAFTKGQTSCNPNPCAAGFTCTVIPNGHKCEDINECTINTHNCHANATCENTLGSFRCTCNKGYRGNGIVCTDIDECADGTHTCTALQQCLNIAGGFECINITRDECRLGTHNCHVNASCFDTPTDFICICNSGFTGNGVICTDVNECMSGQHPCHAQATCQNTVGSFMCVCNPGFTGNGLQCIDINECTIGMHNCHTQANCHNTVGSFNCVCKTGYTGNGISCIDINECALGMHDCHRHANCHNTAGSFTCICKIGYTGNGISCVDIDECATGTHNCPSNKVCENTQGGFRCVPPAIKCPARHGLFPHPTNCHYFIHCAHWRPFVKPCPANLVFNPKEKVCDWPERYPCTRGGGSRLPSGGFCRNRLDGLYAHPNCHHFYQCSNQRTFVMGCPAALYFNPPTNRCERREKVIEGGGNRFCRRG